MWSPGWSGICYLDQTGPEFRDPPASASSSKYWIQGMCRDRGLAVTQAGDTSVTQLFAKHSHYQSSLQKIIYIENL